jgi:hypothetical protein
MKKISLLLWAALWASTAFANYDAKPLPVVKGGLGVNTETAYGIIVGGTTSTSATQNGGTGTSGQLYYSNGASSLGSWTTPTYANTTLSNLGTTSINSSMLPSSSGGENLGSAALPWGTDFANGLELMGSSSGHFVIQAGATTTSWTMTAPSAVCSNGQYWADNGSGVYSCTSPSSSGANAALSNLSAVAINTSLLPASAGSANVGSAALPFGTSFDQVLELMGSSSGNLQIKAGATTTNWTVTAPSAVCASGQYWADNGSGVYSCTSAVVGPTIVNGGNGSYSIPGVNYHVRAATALTANQTYTLPACSGANIASSSSTGKVEVKNLASNSYNIIVAGNGSDTIDGNANYTLYPGDSLPVICAVSGAWDVE